MPLTGCQSAGLNRIFTRRTKTAPGIRAAIHCLSTLAGLKRDVRASLHPVQHADAAMKSGIPWQVAEVGRSGRREPARLGDGDVSVAKGPDRPDDERWRRDRHPLWSNSFSAILTSRAKSLPVLHEIMPRHRERQLLYGRVNVLEQFVGSYGKVFRIC